jgi:hypothetical protein
MLIQWPDRYYHSDLDTPERCDPGSLALAVRAAATYAGFLAGAGAEEAAWLLRLAARGGRRRLVSALERPDPWRAAQAERERVLRALASVSRLAAGLPPGHALPRALARELPGLVEELDGFWAGEIAPALPPAPAAPEPSGRVPVRIAAGLASPMRWLAPGWDALDEPRRARLVELEARLPGGSAALDVAWFACDGERDVPALAEIVAREGWPVEPRELDEWFELAAALGLCRWRDR